MLVPLGTAGCRGGGIVRVSCRLPLGGLQHGLLAAAAELLLHLRDEGVPSGHARRDLLLGGGRVLLGLLCLRLGRHGEALKELLELCDGQLADGLALERGHLSSGAGL